MAAAAPSLQRCLGGHVSGPVGLPSWTEHHLCIKAEHHLCIFEKWKLASRFLCCTAETLRGISTTHRFRLIVTVKSEVGTGMSSFLWLA